MKSFFTIITVFAAIAIFAQEPQAPQRQLTAKEQWYIQQIEMQKLMIEKLQKNIAEMNAREQRRALNELKQREARVMRIAKQQAMYQQRLQRQEQQLQMRAQRMQMMQQQRQVVQQQPMQVVRETGASTLFNGLGHLIDTSMKVVGTPIELVATGLDYVVPSKTTVAPVYQQPTQVQYSNRTYTPGY